MTPAPERPAGAVGRFVGRAKELAIIERSLESARAGQGRIVMLAGPPGIGKTRTAHQAAALAAANGMLTLWGRCPEEPGAPPYWPWMQALRAFLVAPHPPMPNFNLPREQIEDLVAHIKSLPAN